MYREFKEFALRGNVIDMAVGVIVGTAFGKIVTSLVNDILMPPVGLILGKLNFSNIFINLSRGHYRTLADAEEAGAATLNIGLFINTILDFVIIAFAIFLFVKQINRIRRREENSSSAMDKPATKECKYCLSTIPADAVRCKHCTSQLEIKINLK